jgi:hypothetical protein
VNSHFQDLKLRIWQTPLLFQNTMDDFAGTFMYYKWIDFFTGPSDENEDAEERGQRRRSQTADITEEFLVDEDAVILSDEMLEMAWESEEEKRVEREEEKRKGDR